ncbi:hypothetical protein BFJ63_vAg5638 [Fusarium oxysporum f. sp. narcissi]|uniref:Uncharacterized protein n=1 Tax=Fusarium oxysporum f. sp. narcissi TaxID=451672 RepID=A0A4Q2VZI6_FUSOX|nr:hypothetical protein FOMA001_g3876 [Fusarium oxysporum f. sp. matthiolae]RYC91628.1 hypothetical protein BFJ63_vAg5638 [Fusarium oxysporum f. sp. narcissi]
MCGGGELREFGYNKTMWYGSGHGIISNRPTFHTFSKPMIRY